MNISSVKIRAVPQHFHLVRKTKARKNRNALKEKYSRLNSCLAINEANLSDDKIHACDKNGLVLKQKADNIDHLMSLIKEKMSRSKQDK